MSDEREPQRGGRRALADQEALREAEAADEAAARRRAGGPAPAATGDAGDSGGHAAKHQRPGTGREEQTRPDQERAADER